MKRRLLKCTIFLFVFISVPLQVRISEFHTIFRAEETGMLRLGWDNGLSLRKGKEIDIFVKRFNVSEEKGNEV
jgi:hypothetical protein